MADNNFIITVTLLLFVHVIKLIINVKLTFKLLDLFALEMYLP
jgi:hypothetical protein